MEDILDIETPDDLTIDMIKNYLRVDYNLDDMEIALYLKSAKSYVRKYIGADIGEPLDVDLCIPVLNLTAHFYEQRSVSALSNEKMDDIFGAILSINRQGVL